MDVIETCTITSVHICIRPWAQDRWGSLPVLVEVEGKSRQDEGKEGDEDGRRHGAAVSVGVGQVGRRGDGA